ncbi:hypothetical protein FISHEDRAFT_39816 [Fistulina hepatica ATCC 64428]|uniref:Uncharacterized protein n=1 Tax=Fistulina hepatica ATCC 64428 TaxID=1128425 RepID=A0A0D7AFY2_9AGAR|nr:hypothetical protein FISHEDRAFT_39816 [Fistulina hepatica ATCC 64428]
MFRDPWAKANAWRTHPVFKGSAMVRNFLPGFGTALVLFSAYVVFDKMVAKPLKGGEQH